MNHIYRFGAGDRDAAGIDGAVCTDEVTPSGRPPLSSSAAVAL